MPADEGRDNRQAIVTLPRSMAKSQDRSQGQGRECDPLQKAERTGKLLQGDLEVERREQDRGNGIER
jgi:hypothetical protein